MRSNSIQASFPSSVSDTNEVVPRIFHERNLKIFTISSSHQNSIIKKLQLSVAENETIPSVPVEDRHGRGRGKNTIRNVSMEAGRTWIVGEGISIIQAEAADSSVRWTSDGL